MKYVKSTDEEYIYDMIEKVSTILENANYMMKGIQWKKLKKINKPVFIMKTVGYIDYDL